MKPEWSVSTSRISLSMSIVSPKSLTMDRNRSADTCPVLSAAPPSEMNASIVSLSSPRAALADFWFAMTLQNSPKSGEVRGAREGAKGRGVQRREPNREGMCACVVKAFVSVRGKHARAWSFKHVATRMMDARAPSSAGELRFLPISPLPSSSTAAIISKRSSSLGSCPIAAQQKETTAGVSARLGAHVRHTRARH
jgi:hypothetical protein